MWRKQKIHNFLSKKKQVEVIISYSLTYYPVIETVSFLQLLQAEYMGMWGLWGEVDWRQEPPLLGGTEEEAQTALPH